MNHMNDYLDPPAPPACPTWCKEPSAHYYEVALARESKTSEHWWCRWHSCDLVRLNEDDPQDWITLGITERELINEHGQAICAPPRVVICSEDGLLEITPETARALAAALAQIAGQAERL